MKQTIPALPIIAAFSGLVGAQIDQPLRIDVSGYEFRDGLGDADNMVFELFVGALWEIDWIEWNLNLTTLTAPGNSFPSWGSEAHIDFNGQIDLQVSNTSDGVINENNAGFAIMEDYLGGPLTLASDGIFRMEFYETFVDSPGIADAVLGEGSWIRIPVQGPTPGPLAAMGLGGLFAAKRRRIR